MAHNNELEGKKVAILATDGFEEVELTDPLKKLKNAGAEVHLISEKKKIRSWQKREWGKEFGVDMLLDDADPGDYDALILPGGVINPDRLRRNDQAVDFIKKFQEAHKLIAAICHGPQMLIEADLVRGRKLTSFHSVKTDLINAGASWEDQEVALDDNLITSRHPGDIPAWINKIIEMLK